MPAGRRLAKIVIKADDSMNLGARQVERLGDQRHRLTIDVAELFLQGVQDRQRRTIEAKICLDDLLGTGAAPWDRAEHSCP